MRISCITLTEQGKESLRQAINENKELLKTYNFKQRQEFKNTWKEIIIDTGKKVNYTLILKARSGLGASYYITKQFTKSVNSAKDYNNNLGEEFNKMENEIETAMFKNGSTRDIDYTIEVFK